MKKISIAVVALTIALVGASVVNAVFTRNLSVGSTGADVADLQTMLLGKGYVIPALSSGAASKGYFGSQTLAAVKRYQADNGVPNTGFVGPLTLAKLNGGSTMASAMVLPFPCPVGYVVPAGWVCPGTTTTTTGTVLTGITTPGVEGTLSATQSNSGLASSVYEGDSMVPVLGVKLDVKSSDIAIQRIKLNLGTETKIYNKIFKRVYITDGSAVLGSADLNSSTVVKDGSNYFITVAGMNYVIPRGTSRNLVIKVDVSPTIDTNDLAGPYTISLATADAVRGVDGAGIYQYAGTSAITKSYAISTSLIEAANLKVSLNTSSVKKGDYVATEGSSENQLDALPLMSFDLKAEKDSVKVTDLAIGVTASGSGTATASTTVRLFEGSTELDSVSLTGTVAVFNDLDYVIAKDATKTFTVKVDVRSANSSDTRFVATASSSGVTAENSQGDSVTASYKSGSATGSSIGVRNVGPVVTLVTAPTMTKSVATVGDYSTSTAKATYLVSVKAVGGDITFGTNASATPMFGTTSPSFYITQNGASTVLLVASSTAFASPSSGVVAVTNGFTLQEGNTMVIPVDFLFDGRKTAANGGGTVSTGSYAVGMAGIYWNGNQSTTFMSGELDWTTPTVVLP